MSNKLIMPKQTGQLDAFYASLELLYISYHNKQEWYNNEQFKVEIQKKLPYLSDGAQNGPYLVKQSELVRYFGLVEYNYDSRKSRITELGIEFYNAYQNNDVGKQLDILINSIFTNSFGRNNTAIKSSDSDIDPPKLFLKAIVDLNGITSRDLAFLIYVTHDLKVAYEDAIIELRISNDKDREIPLNLSNKYNDVKFTNFLSAIGVVIKEGNVFKLSQYTSTHYLEEIKKLSIYNKKPEFIFSLREDDDDDESIDDFISDDVLQDKIQCSFVYDITTEKFKSQNNRSPSKRTIGSKTKYITNPRLSKTALELNEYKCLIDSDHITFNTKAGTQYMEAHHFIPMSAQKDFEPHNLDRIENIVSICPTCHSAIHYGDNDTRHKMIKRLYALKEKELKAKNINITFEELFDKYYR